MDNDYFSNGGILPPRIPLNSISADTFMNTHCDNSTDQFTQFNSALSSMPVASNSNNCEIFSELIGKLGTLYTSSPASYVENHDNNSNSDSTRASCYNTPLHSPSNFENLVPLPVSANPGFPAKFSCFGGPSFNDQFGLNNAEFCSSGGKMLVQNNQMMLSRSNLCPKANFNYESSVPDQNASTRKRKAGSRKELGPILVGNGGEADNCTRERRSKPVQGNGNKNGSVKMEEQASDEAEKKEKEKDYIHVRARRGQATDSHSLAERVRREKISQRMKLLQDLVPGCNKVTGKAVMLDEIINYVQSLQHQVEFLSMKLATVKPSMNLHINNHLPKDIYQPRVFPLDGFGGNPTQLPIICEDDLQSIVQMGFSKD